MVNPVGLVQKGKDGVAQSIEAHRERLVEANSKACAAAATGRGTDSTVPTGHIGFQETDGQPFLDVYFLMGPVGVGKGFSADPSLKLDEVSTPEAAEVLAINTLAPFIINSRLRSLLEAALLRSEPVMATLKVV